MFKNTIINNRGDTDKKTGIYKNGKRKLKLYYEAAKTYKNDPRRPYFWAMSCRGSEFINQRTFIRSISI